MVQGEPSGYFLVLGPSGSGLTTAQEHFGRYGFMSVSGVRPDDFEPVFTRLIDQHDRIVFTLRLLPEDKAGLAVARSLRAGPGAIHKPRSLQEWHQTV